ncbi:MAG: uroporphyrinogen decarboxylase [Deltaproteobacteria bacterium]|nr:MAG: uroporphyrinogen decarboxylase [Deltaproteobacteria bacterium]
MKANFDGMRVVAFESRRAKEIEKLITYYGGIPQVAPSMREVPLSETTQAFEFAEELFNGKIDIVILLTGVGTRTLVDIVTTKYSRDKFIESLKNTTIVARGPKPVSALRELGLKPDVIVPEPNTWRDILSSLDSTLPLNNKTVAVQEYGVSNTQLLNGLRERGARVKPVAVYRWALPEDIKPLVDAIHSISFGKVEVVLFTSSQQVYHLIEVARQKELEKPLREGLKRVVIGSIGPTTTETLNNFGFTVDYEPNSPKMGNFVREIARRAHYLLTRKQIAYSNGVDTGQWKRIDMIWYRDVPKKKVNNSVFLKACNREPTDYTPIWLMRQAGRFLREYRELRARVSFLELCKTPELAAEVTLMAVDRLGVDAAIIFADILLILEPLGVELEFSKGEGPRIKKPLRSTKALDTLREFNPDELDFVYKAVEISRRALAPEIALIGFAGAPFTVASYLIEGGSSRNYENTKGLMYRDPEAWHVLMDKLTHATLLYLNRQIDSGADAVQIFDSWVGCLSPEDYRDFVLPYMKKLIQGIRPGVPVIHFGTGTASLLDLMKEAGSSVIGLDWRIELDEAWKRLGYDVAIQGNLDPAVLLATPSEIKRRAIRILDKAAGREGHIFNLGHGVLPSTPVDNVLTLVDTVHEYSSTRRKNR